MNYCVADFEIENPMGFIDIGVIGSDKSVNLFCEWLDRCRSEIKAKDSRQPNLFAPFPGFNSESGFQCELRTDSSFHRIVRPSEIREIADLTLDEERKLKAVEMFWQQARDLLEKRRPRVLVCALPEELLEALYPSDDSETNDDEDGSNRIDFHDLLKAKCLSLPSACPLQLVLPGTYDPDSKRRRKRRADDRARPLQDEATRAWNFWTAVYYKAGGTPWKLIRKNSDFPTCFIGIGFFRTLDRERVDASVAQVFNERGEGVIVRGGEATYEKSDRQIHLDSDSANAIVKNAIETYRFEHKTVPARVVIHKSSPFSPGELEGCQSAVNDWKIEYSEMVSMSKSFTRLFRKQEYPPLRGTMLTLEKDVGILYTRGSVEFYETYPGMYMPRTLRIEAARTERSLESHAAEILALTKMNWNDTQLDGSLPITLRAARQVGSILRYLGPKDDLPHDYSFYM